MSDENFPEKIIVEKLTRLGEAFQGTLTGDPVFPPNFPGKKVADKIDELIAIVEGEGGVFALKADLEAETAAREAYDAQQDQKIQTLNGHYYPIEPYDFGKSLDVKTPNPDDVTLLNTYAMTMEAVADPSQIIDGTVVKNLFDGVEFVWNATSQTWQDWGIGNIVTASNEHLGVVEGTADPGDGSKDGMVTVHPGGTMEAIGFTGLKEDVAGKLDIQQSPADEGKAMIIGPAGELEPGVSGKVDSIDEVGPEADTKDVQLFQRITQEEAQALIDNPSLAVPGRKYYVPETGDLLVERPDYANQETINRISVNNGTWVVDRAGYVQMSLLVVDAGGNRTRGFVNDRIVARGEGGKNGDSTYVGYCGFAVVQEVSKGDTVRMWYENATGGVEEFFCYFVPSKFVVIKNPTLVVKEDSDYSYDEKPVMTKLPDGTVRQEVTEKGNPLFQRTFTFSFTTAAAAERSVKWQAGGVFLKRFVEGWWSTIGDAAKNPIGVVVFVGTDTDNISQFSTYLDSLDAGVVRLWWSNYYNGLFNKSIAGHVTLEYTKVYESE